MLNIFKTEDHIITQLQRFEEGVWIQLIDPTSEELSLVAEAYQIEPDDLASALDAEETSRIALEDDYTLILMDLPFPEVRHHKTMYTTMPLGIIVLSDTIITICRQKTPILEDFVRGRVRDFSSKKKMKFVYQICLRSASIYQLSLRQIDKQRTEVEERVGEKTQDSDLIDLHELESTLVYFSTSLRANIGVIERLRRYKRLEQYDDDMDLLEDVLVEYQQAIEMAAIYRDIIDGTRDLLYSIIDTRMNRVMKYLTAITLVTAVPTVITGIYGMNVDENWMPFAKTPHGFTIVCAIIAVICVVVLLILRKKKML